jgi:enoyl-CoA hydratase
LRTLGDQEDRDMTTTDGYTKITVSGSDGIAVLTLASDKVNALDVATLGEIASYLDRAAPDPAVRALVVTGAGSIFSAGLNVNEVLDHEKDRTGVLLDALRDALVGLFRFPKPTVAAINGPAIAGGCILACACDKRLIAAGARIGATELKVGVAFPVFAVELLRHACGSSAEQLMFDAALLDAEEACACGLAHQVVTADSLAATATELATQLAGLAKASSRRVALAVLDDDACRRLDGQVLDHWRDDQTRANLDRLRKPKA